MTQLALLLLLLLSVVAYFLSSYYVTDIFALDWYDPAATEAYKFMNFTYIRIVENTILLTCCYLHRYALLIRNYPKDFNISQEINMLCLSNWVLCCYFEILSRHQPARSYCFLGIYNLLGFGEVFRSCSIILSLYILTLRSHDHATKTYIWLFNDLSKFILEPTCYLTFLRYLTKKEPRSKID